MDRDGRLVDAELTKAETDGDPVLTEAVMSVVPPLPPAPPPTLVLVAALLVVVDTAFISGA